MNIIDSLSHTLGISREQIAETVRLIDSGASVPFIARYRKEVTGNLDDQTIRILSEKLSALRALFERKNDVKRLISEQGSMTDELSASIEACASLNEVEDIYRPFRPKRRTRAMIAREKGLEGFARLILAGDSDMVDLEKSAQEYIDTDKGVNDTGDVLAGANDIIAEEISDDALLRKRLRTLMINTGMIRSSAKKKEQSVYEMYYDYSEPVKAAAGHRVLAIDRGEKEGFLSVKVVIDEEVALHITYEHFIRDLRLRKEACRELVRSACKDSWKRLVEPSLQTEIRNILTEDAQDKAIVIFSLNLKNILMQAPVRNKVVLGFDPAYRTGCKLAVVDATGMCLDTIVIYPHEPHNRKAESEKIVCDLVNKYKVEVIAVGNGTASGESERFVAEIVKKLGGVLAYCIVNEAGASVYSASELGAKEFPDLDVSFRSAVSIARRLQDPLAELVKIDPRSIGVGQYQHDMEQKKLAMSLQGVVEDCVNTVGVELNSASPSLLSYVAGIGPQVAANIVEWREANGRFTSRRELLKVKKLGPATYEQCAGFLRISDSVEFFDRTAVHPESYSAVRKMLELLGGPEPSMAKELAERYGLNRLASDTGIGTHTLTDILEAIAKPGRDPRGDDFEMISGDKPMDIKELSEGMILQGTVRNVSAFGAFVDIGVHQDGLVHISELADRFVSDPHTVVSAGQRVKIRVLSVDIQRKRISLSMKNM